MAQREHSTVELRGKLLRAARRQHTLQEAAAPPTVDGPHHRTADRDRMAALLTEVDDVISWMQAHDFLSDARFVESRLNARASVQGLLRIRRELASHHLAVPAECAEDLRQSEFDRASALRLRRFGDEPPGTPAELARQYRFLVQRGFAGEVVTKVLRALKRAA